MPRPLPASIAKKYDTGKRQGSMRRCTTDAGIWMIARVIRIPLPFDDAAQPWRLLRSPAMSLPDDLRSPCSCCGSVWQTHPD
ncbi:hypothetical protein [Xanthomonas sp. 3793]|uniref:Transposase n=1 Tax=Xanthomonas sp. 10-10 TaxID=3115848 RepID=A0AAU7P572_9XANT|nr:hypothetical protein [Xanthomonas sp. 3793]MCS3745420.1 hypothetical protein [Xanthomonas sp. 3793]